MYSDDSWTNDRAQVWAVAGGKGGTGKSLVAANLGVHLAMSGLRVVMVDGDLGAANLHTFLGLAPPPVSLSDFIQGRVLSLDDVVVQTAVPRLRLISSARNSLDVESLKHFQKTRLLRLILRLSADVVVLDLGAGTSLNILDLFSIADRGVLTILPEPTSVENYYRFLKAAFLRRLQTVGRSLGFESILSVVLKHRGRFEHLRQTEILEEIRRIDACAADALETHLDGFLPRLIINQARDHMDARMGELLEVASERFLGIPARFVGAIPYERVIIQTIKSQRPLLLEYPRCAAARAIRAACDQIAAAPERRRSETGGRWGQQSDGLTTLSGNPYAVLDLASGATQEEILGSYLRIKRALRSDSPALVSLDCEPERRAALAEVEAAYRQLSRNFSARPVVRSAGQTGARRAPRQRGVPLL